MNDAVSSKQQTYDFVRQTGRDRYFAARDRELALLQGEDGRIRPEFSRAVTACPVCSGSGFHTVLEKQGFLIRQCQQDDLCGHFFADPQINEEKLMAAYRGHHGQQDETPANDLWVDVLLSDANRAYDSEKYQRGVDAIVSILATRRQDPPRILDVGCSAGLFLDVIRRNGWETVGLELSQKAVRHARETLGLDVRPQLLDQAGFPDQHFDAITLWGVIEHLQQPLVVMRQIAALLKPGGVFLAYCPNGASLACRVLREQAATYDGRFHPSYFTPRSLAHLLTRAGLVPHAPSFEQLNLEPVLNHLDWRDPYRKDRDRPNPLMELLSSQEWNRLETRLLEAGLGYKMMMTASKPEV